MNKVFSKLDNYKKLQTQLKCKNLNGVPKFLKVCINRGIGFTSEQSLTSNITEVSLLSGQYPKVTKSKKSISNFKIRKNMKIGLKVTLREARMYSFITKFIYLVLPKIKNFQGLDILNFDKNGNYNFGINSQLLFPEIDYSSFEKNKNQGLNITFVTTTKNKYHSFLLLKQFKFPFATYDNW